MQPKSSSTTSLTALDAFAREHGLDEEYRQKLAALMGLQMAPPKEREVIDLDEWQRSQNARAIDLDAPPVIDLDAQPRKREVIDLDEWQRSQNARAIDLDAPPVIDLDAPAQREVIDLDEWQRSQNARAIDLDAPPVIDLDEAPPPQGREFIDYNAMGRPKMDMYAQAPSQAAQPQGFSEVTSDAPTITKAMTPYELYRSDPKAYFEHQKAMEAANKPSPAPVSGETWKDKLNYAFGMPRPLTPSDLPLEEKASVSPLDKARAAQASVVDQNAIPPLEKWKGGAASGGAASGMLKGLVGKVQEDQKGLKDAYKGVEDAQVASFDPAIKSNAAMAQNQRDIGALQNYEARLMEQRVKEFNTKKAEIDSSIKREQDRLMGMDPLDPKRAWNQASFGGKIGLAIGAMLSGFAGPEVLKQYTEQIFGKDFEAQKLAYEKQKGNVDMQTNRYAMLMNQLKDDAAVRAAYFAPIYKALESKAGEIAATGGSEQARASAENAKQHFRLQGAQAEMVSSQSTLSAALKSVGSAMAAPSAGEGSKQSPYVLNEKMKLDQERISKKLVKTTRGIFEAPNDTNRGKFEEELNGGFELIDAVENARALAAKTSAFEGVGNKLTTEDYAALKSAIASITGTYAKAKALGALDKNLQELMSSIVGDMFNVGRVSMLLNNMANTTRRNVQSYMDKYTLKPLHAAYARDPMYGNSITQVWVPGGYSQKAMSPLDISPSKVQGPGE